MAEAQTPGCWGVFATEASSLRFRTLCGDGTMLTVTHDASGQPSGQKRSARMFDPDTDPVFLHSERVGNTLTFVSFNGNVYSADLSDETPAFAQPWPVIDAADRKAGWKPGGYQLFALHAATGRLYLGMHPRAQDGSHKSPAAEDLRTIDLAQRKRVARAPGQSRAGARDHARFPANALRAGRGKSRRGVAGPGPRTEADIPPGPGRGERGATGTASMSAAAEISNVLRDPVVVAACSAAAALVLAHSLWPKLRDFTGFQAAVRRLPADAAGMVALGGAGLCRRRSGQRGGAGSHAAAAGRGAAGGPDGGDRQRRGWASTCCAAGATSAAAAAAPPTACAFRRACWRATLGLLAVLGLAAGNGGRPGGGRGAARVHLARLPGGGLLRACAAVAVARRHASAGQCRSRRRALSPHPFNLLVRLP
ncbi:amine dehydrogenase large subunit [Cupriavidus basilensis]